LPPGSPSHPAARGWVEQTLVTVDVTGTWRSTEGVPFEIRLEQQGAKVTGSVLRAAVYGARNAGPIEGSVGGDVVRFRQTGGGIQLWEGELTGSGNEMAGQVQSRNGGYRGRSILRRVDSSAPPGSPR
jgi:hypothetical protein